MSRFIPVNEPLLNGNERKYLNQCLDSGWISSEGPFVKQFEEGFSRYCGCAHGVAVCNGSVAIDLALRALKETYQWQPRDEVIVPNFTIISCAQSVIYQDLTPIFVDCEPQTFNIDVQQIEAAITPRTRAIMPVHIYGLPCDMDGIMQLAQRHNLLVIEDAAEAHGQFYHGKVVRGRCGGLGEIATFSFYPNKHITTGEGGMVVTSNAALAEKCHYYKNLCFTAQDRFVHHDLGWNFRLTNLQAALGLAQFERLDEFIAIKRAMGRRYTEMLQGIPAQLPVDALAYAENHYWVYPLVLHDDVPFTAKQAMERLAQAGIGCRPFFYPMDQQPVLRERGVVDAKDRPVSRHLYQRGFYIPSGLALTEEQIETTARCVKGLFA